MCPVIETIATDMMAVPIIATVILRHSLKEKFLVSVISSGESAERLQRTADPCPRLNKESQMPINNTTQERPSTQNLLHQKFNRLTAIGYVGRYRNTTNAEWLWRCDCGNLITMSANAVKRGNTKSCGCLKRETRSTQTHGMARRGKHRTPEYHIWSAMIQRCANPENKGYERYGKRGIRVCERWLIFENFLADMGPRPTLKLTLERKNNNLGYSPENCEWASRRLQMRNNSRTLVLTLNGETMCLTDWVARLETTISKLR